MTFLRRCALAGWLVFSSACLGGPQPEPPTIRPDSGSSADSGFRDGGLPGDSGTIMDAGWRDGATPDGGPSDGGMDADGGPGDAGPDDAGADADVGLGDAGPSDAGPSDASADADAAPSDATVDAPTDSAALST